MLFQILLKFVHVFILLKHGSLSCHHSVWLCEYPDLKKSSPITFEIISSVSLNSLHVVFSFPAGLVLGWLQLRAGAVQCPPARQDPLLV